MATTLSEPTTTAAELTSYRAAVVHEFHAPLTVDEVPATPLQAGQTTAAARYRAVYRPTTDDRGQRWI